LGTSYCSDPTYLQRHSYRVSVEIRRALEGTLVASQTFYGSPPRAAKNTEAWSTVKSGLWGSKVGYSSIESWIKAYISPRSSYTCEDELGCVDVVPGAPLEIGALFAMSDTYGYLGVDSLRGMEIAAQDIGEVLGHPIRIVELDSQCSEDQGVAMAARLAENEWFLGAIGATCGHSTYAAASVLSDEGMVLISPSVSTVWLTDPLYHQAGFLRVIPNDLEQAKMVAEFAFKELEARTMATIHEGSLYGGTLQERACEVFSSLGGECVAQEEMKKGETDAGQLMNKIATASPDVIYMAVLMDNGAELVQHARDTSSLESIPLIGSNTLFNKHFLELSGSSAKDLHISGLMIGADFYTPQYEDFLEKYNEMYGSNPNGLYHAYGYDALSLLTKTIQNIAVKDPDGTLHIPRQALRDALYSTSYFYGLTGTLNCTAEGDCGEKNSIRILQFVDTASSNFNPGQEEDSNPIVVYP
jgi:branched-chain amino acid transport system substrate-binding protein